MLTGNKIFKELKNGNIIILPFDKDKINPNSYNLTLGNKILIYKKTLLDPIDIRTLETEEITIPEKGMVLYPDMLYLGTTVEHTETKKYVPCISGRSSIGRLGINIHATAGFGDVGFKGKWTLELFVIHPVMIYPGMEIAQIYYFKPHGRRNILYHGKYQNQEEPLASKIIYDM